MHANTTPCTKCDRSAAGRTKLPKSVFVPSGVSASGKLGLLPLPLGGGRGGEGASLHALSLCMPPPCPSPASGGGDDVARIRQQPVGRNKRSALRHATNANHA